MSPGEGTTIAGMYIVVWLLYSVWGGVEGAMLPRKAYSETQDWGRPPDAEYPDPGSRGTHQQHSHSELNDTVPCTGPDTQEVSGSQSRGRALCANATSDHPLVSGVFLQGRIVHTMDFRCRNFEFAVSFIFVGITCLFGFVGNILSILTLRRDSIKSVTTFLLSALAVADFTFLVPAVFVIMIPTYCEYSQHCVDGMLHVIPVFEQYGWAIMSSCHTCTVYVTVLVAIHRYLWVCRLHIAQRFSGLRRVKFQVGLVPVCALIYNCPRFFEYRIVKYAWNDTVATEGHVIRTETAKILADVGKHDIFQIGYKNVLYCIIMYVIPLSILVMVSVNLIKTLKQRRATLQRIGSTSSTASQARRDDNITFVLVIIIAAFTICQTPLMILRLMLAMSKTDNDANCGGFYFYFEHISEYLALLNSSTNFVIYILFSPHFRHTLMAEVLCKHARTGNSGIRLSSIRTRKLPSDERNAMALLEMLPNNNNAIALSALTGHIAASVCGLGQHNISADGAENKWLLPPEVNDKSATSSNYLSHSSQITHLSHDDPRTNEGATDDIIEGATDDIIEGATDDIIATADCRDDTSDPEKQTPEKNVDIPLISLEHASSKTESDI